MAVNELQELPGKPWERDWVRDWEPGSLDRDEYDRFAQAEMRRRFTGQIKGSSARLSLDDPIRPPLDPLL